MPKPGTKRSGVFGKIPDLDRNHGVWSGSDRVPIGLGPNFPNTRLDIGDRVARNRADKTVRGTEARKLIAQVAQRPSEWYRGC